MRKLVTLTLARLPYVQIAIVSRPVCGFLLVRPCDAMCTDAFRRDHRRGCPTCKSSMLQVLPVVLCVAMHGRLYVNYEPYVSIPSQLNQLVEWCSHESFQIVCAASAVMLY